MLRLSKPPEPNLKKYEFQSICRVNDNPNIIVLKFNKGNATVIMNTSDYESKLQDLASSSSINLSLNVVTKAIKYSSLDPIIKKRFIPQNPQTTMIYGQPKFTKKTCPFDL
jgi:hypothetical protein